MAVPAKPRPVHWYTVPVRVALITFILTLLSFALCLFVAIIGTVIAARLHGVSPDMRVAYRHIALPCAFVVGALVLIVSTFNEVRHYRQSKTLARIVHASHHRAA